MDYKKKLQEILDKKNQQYGEDSINLSVLGEEINDVEHLLEKGLGARTAKEMFWHTTSGSLFELLIEYIAGPCSDDIGRCSSKTCPVRGHCVRFFLGTSKKPGVYSYTDFESEFETKEPCRFKIEI